MLVRLFHLGFLRGKYLPVSKTDGWAATTAADPAISRMFSQHFKLAGKTGVYIPQLRIRRACAQAELSLAMQMWGLKTRRRAERSARS